MKILKKQLIILLLFTFLVPYIGSICYAVVDEVQNSNQLQEDVSETTNSELVELIESKDNTLINNLEDNIINDKQNEQPVVEEETTKIQEEPQDNIIENQNTEEVSDITDIEENVDELEIAQSSGLPVINITLNGTTLDEINRGSKETKYDGNTVELIDSNNSKYNFTDNNAQIKGRGNLTWGLAKKPYQIKLSSKTNVLGMGKAKKWILLANYTDNSLVRNKLIFDLANEIGLAYSSNAEWVELCVDGIYQGNYLLCEKVEIGSKRVELTDNKGLLAELDNTNYADEENYFESKKSSTIFTLSESVSDDLDSNESISKKSFEEFEDFINEFEDLLYADDKNFEKISSMIDLESFIKYYFIQELSEDPDGCRSSVFMYKDGDNDKLHLGPVWDYDSALGNYTNTNLGGNTSIDYTQNIKKYMSHSNDWFNQLLKIKEFRSLVTQIYNNEIKPIFNTATTKISNYKTKLEKSAALNFTKWETQGKPSLFPGNERKNKDTYDEEVEYLSDWVSNRLSYLNKRYSADSSIVNITYNSHVQDYGWEEDYIYSNGETSGTTGQNKKIEALKINFDTFNTDFSKNTNIVYQSYLKGMGWQSEVQAGQVTGTTGQNRKIEAIRISLTGSEDYSISYRTHVENIGWTGWVFDGNISGSIDNGLKIEAIQIKLVPKVQNQDLGIEYNSHVQDYGWENDFSHSNGNISGTTGQNKKVEAMKIRLVNASVGSSLKYSTYVEGNGWQPWSENGQISGTTGQNRKIYGVKLKLENVPNYSVEYRVHIENEGWMNWTKENKVAGLINSKLKIEAIQIKIVESSTYSISVAYSSHVQDYGWENDFMNMDGEVSGTTGQNKKIEALKIKLLNAPNDANIQYETFVADKGWLDIAQDGEIAGTVGENRKVYGIRINLNGLEDYSVKYKVHIQDKGWMDWKQDGEVAGLIDSNLKIEAIEVKLVHKNM